MGLASERQVVAAEAAKADGRFAMRAASESGAEKFGLSLSVAARRDAGARAGSFAVVRRTMRKRRRPKPLKGRQRVLISDLILSLEFCYVA